VADDAETAVIPRPRKPRDGEGASDAPPAPSAEERSAPRARPTPTPTLLDFFPLEDARSTELSAFFDHLKEGRFTTTQCRRDHELHWPPRSVCPKCHQSELDWVELPRRGRIYAHSAVLAGAPLGMEADVPFVVGLVDLEGAPLRIFGRIEGAPWDRLAIGQEVHVEPYTLPDGRVFYRFRVPGSPPRPGL
jgi:uncharacterized protein